MEVITDNGRCFIAASKKSCELLSDLDDEKLKEALSPPKKSGIFGILIHYLPPTLVTCLK